MKRMKFLFHMGYIKTGTTWMQAQVFPRLENTLYFGKKNNDGSFINDEIRKIHRELFILQHNRSRGNSEALINEYSKLIKGEIVQRLSGNSNITRAILSCEDISNFANSSLINAELNIYLLYRLMKKLKESLADFCELELSVLFTFREQASLLKSYYSSSYFTLKYKFPTFEKFLDYGIHNHHDMVFGGLWYDEIYQNLIDLSNIIEVEVIFVPYELMVQDCRAFLEKSIGFLGNTDFDNLLENSTKELENVTPKTDSAYLCVDTHLIRRIAHILSRKYKSSISDKYLCHVKTIHLLLNKLFDGIKTKRVLELNDEQLKTIQDLYRNSNSRLSKLISTDLRRFGYSVNDNIT